MPLYQLNNKQYDIPDSLADKFLAENPIAKPLSTYKINNKVYDIPTDLIYQFLAEHPEAQLDQPESPIGLKVPLTFEQQMDIFHKGIYDPDEEVQLYSGELSGRPSEPASGFSGNWTDKEVMREYSGNIGENLEQFAIDKVKALGRGANTILYGSGGFLQAAGVFLNYLNIEETGKSLSEFSEQLEKNYLEAQQDTDILEDLFTALGSSGPFFFIGGGIAKGIGKTALVKIIPRLAALLGTGSMAVLEAATESGYVYENMIDQGETKERAKGAATGTFLMNLPLNYLLDKWFINGSNETAKQVGARMFRMFQGGKNEFFQEYFQEMISSFWQGDNILSKEVQSSGIYQAIIGGTVGGATGYLTGTAGKKIKLNPGNTDLLNPEDADALIREENAQREREGKPIIPIPPKEDIIKQQEVQPKPETTQDINIQSTQTVTSNIRQDLGSMFKEIADVLDESQALVIASKVGLDNVTDEQFSDLQELSKTGSTAENFIESKAEFKPLPKDLENQIESGLGLTISENEYNTLANKLNESLIEPEKELTQKAVISTKLKIISGGQTGIDQLGLEVAKNLGLETGGIAPLGFRTEIGPNLELKEKYGLSETKSKSANYLLRTRENIVNSDGTVIFGNVESAGSEQTLSIAKSLNKPVLVNPSSIELANWIKENNIQILNVAGNRGSKLSQAQLDNYKQILREGLSETKRLPNIDEIGGGLPFREQPKAPEEPDTPDDTEKGEESTTDEPRYDSNYAANTLLMENIIRKDQLNDAIKLIRAMVKRASTPSFFMETFRKQFPLSKISNNILHGTYRREQTLEEFNVVDMDIIMEGRNIKKIDVNPSTFYNHKGMLQSNRFLSNPLLNKFRDRLVVLKGYISSEFADKYTGKRKELMPYNRHSSLEVRDLSTFSMRVLHNALMKMKLTLLPVSDSNTLMAIRIDPKYMRVGEESSEQLKIRLISELSTRYPADINYYNELNTFELASELTRDDFMKEALSFWYSGGMKMNEVAKRWKLFLPKGEQLSFNRNIRIAKVDDIWVKDGKGNFVLKPDGTRLSVTDGNMMLNPRFATDFFQYNGLGNIKQDKTIVTESNDKHNIAIKQMAHVATTAEWKSLCSQSNVDESVDIIAYDTSFKLANKSDKSRYENGDVIELEPKAFRHLFSGNDHSMATFSRQMFNFFGTDTKLIESAKEQIIDPVYARVKEKFLDFSRNPKTLEQYLLNLFHKIPQEISDFRRYASQGAILFKTLRSNVKKFLKNTLITNEFVKLKQEGNYSYLRPDFFQEVNRGELYIPYSEFERVFYLAVKNGFYKYGKDLSIYSKDQYNTIRQELNKWIRANNIKVITARVPISRVENIQALTIRKILDNDAGNCAVMNTIDAVYNKEADFDGDEIFFHYLDNISNLNILINNIAKIHENVEFINLTNNDPGSANKLESLFTVAKWSGDGKKAIGETAKANAIKAVLLANNLKLGLLLDGSMRIVKPNDKMDQYIQIYKLRKDWTKWDNDISHTMQAAVDNLKKGALENAAFWDVVKDESGGYNVYYNLRKIYAEMFDGEPDLKLVNSTLRPISNVMNLFSRNFAIDASWDQDTLNMEAQKYAKIVENMEGALGNSIHEHMILKLADLGYLPNLYEFTGDRTNVEQTATKEQRATVTMNNLHDLALSNAVSDFRQDFITNKEPDNLSKTRKDEIKEIVKDLYKEKKQGEIETGSTEEDRYYKLYEAYLDKVKEFTAAEKDYFDYLTIKGFTYNNNLQLISEQNYRFILATLSDRNVKRIAERFNKRFTDMVRKNSASMNFLIPVNPQAIQEKWDSIKQRYGTAIANFFGDIHLNMDYKTDDDTIYADALKVVDRINRELYQIGRLPFSDAVDMKALYSSILSERGKTFGVSPLTAADGIAILNRLKKLEWNLEHGSFGDFAAFTYFTADLLKNNPYTSKYIKNIDLYSSKKDAQTQHWMSWISYTGKGEVQKGIRELMDMKQHGYVRFSYMHEALDTFNLYSDLQYYNETEQYNKRDNVQKKIDQRLKDPYTKRQMEILNDVIRALDGQIKIGETPDGEPLYIQSQEGNEKYLLDKWNGMVATAYVRSRELLNEIIKYDEITWSKYIGPNTEYYINDQGKRVKSWQWTRLQTVRKKLVDSGKYSPLDIEKIIKTLEIPRPTFYTNYYPHMYFGIQTARELSFNIMNALDISTPLKDLEDSIKSLSYWKERESRKPQPLDKMADRNLIRVLTRRANASVQARWQNTFRTECLEMTTSIYNGMQKETEQGHLENVKMLARLQAIADEMYKRVADIPEYSWLKSMSNVHKDLYLLNLLLLSTKGILRNKTQGFFPNIVEFGLGTYFDGYKLIEGGYNPKGEIGKAAGDFILTTGEVRNIFQELGVHRADTFAKIESGQEWDIFKSVKKAAEYNKAIKDGKLPEKVKYYLPQALQNIEERMNKVLMTVGRGNIFTFFAGLGRRTFVGAWDKIVPIKYRIPIPDMPITKHSYSGVEYSNRAKTAAMAFISELKSISSGRRIAGITPEMYNLALSYARQMISKLQYNYNMWNRPIGLSGPIRSNFFQFKSYQLGTVKLHWNWLTDLRLDPYVNIHKPLWFATFLAVLFGLNKLLHKDFLRFFEIPEIEFFRGLRDLLIGDRQEREFAWYGNRSAPVSGPSGGMLYELSIINGITDADSRRKQIAWFRMVEAHIPVMKEFNDVYKNTVKTIRWDQDFGRSLFDYVGLYPTYKESDARDGRGRAKEKYEGPVREAIKDVIDDRMSLYHIKQALYPKKSTRGR